MPSLGCMHEAAIPLHCAADALHWMQCDFWNSSSGGDVAPVPLASVTIVEFRRYLLACALSYWHGWEPDAHPPV